MTKKYNKRTDGELLKQIVVFRADNPDLHLSEVAKKFGVSYNSVRYAITKYSKDIGIIKIASKKEKQNAAKILSSHLSEEEILNDQLKLILGEIKVSDNLSLTARLDLNVKYLNLKKRVQAIELSSHMKRADAELISAIIRRFFPEATKDDIIKIYREELEKIKNSED